LLIVVDFGLVEHNHVVGHKLNDLGFKIKSYYRIAL